MFNTDLNTFVRDHVFFHNWREMPEVNGYYSSVDVAGVPTLSLTVSRTGDGKGYYVVHSEVVDLELGDGMTVSPSSAQRDALQFARYLVKLIWREGAPDALVKQQAIEEFLADCKIVDWQAHPDEPGTEFCGVDHDGEYLFSGFVR